MTYSKVSGTGSYVPKLVVTNSMLEAIVDTSDEWIVSRTGIKERHMSVDENTSDLAYKASLKALEAANTKAEDLDLIIVATVTPDFVFPGVSQLLGKRLGCNMITAFDINAACSGFVYALDVADKMIQSKAYKKALIVGAETLTKYTDYEDRNTCVLFADGAGAMVLEASDYPYVKKVVTHSNGDDEGFLRMDGYPLKKDFKTPEQKRPFAQMKGSDVFKFATKVLPETLNELFASLDMKAEDLDLVVAHQANQRIIQKAAKDLKFPMDKMFMNIDTHGNTSAASVPLAIDEAIRTHKLKKGDVFATVAFGAGLTWGGAIIEL